MTYLTTSTEKPSTVGFCHSCQAFIAASLRIPGKRLCDRMLNNYKNFLPQVNKFLTNYLRENNDESLDREGMRIEFQMMLDFVEKYFHHGFQKGIKRTITPRIRFEAISVGVALALREKSDLVPTSMEWLDSREFKEYTTLDASNSRPKVIRRIEYVRDQLLGKS